MRSFSHSSQRKWIKLGTNLWNLPATLRPDWWKLVPARRWADLVEGIGATFIPWVELTHNPVDNPSHSMEWDGDCLTQITSKSSKCMFAEPIQTWRRGQCVSHSARNVRSQISDKMHNSIIQKHSVRSREKNRLLIFFFVFFSCCVRVHSTNLILAMSIRSKELNSVSVSRNLDFSVSTHNEFVHTNERKLKRQLTKFDWIFVHSIKSERYFQNLHNFFPSPSEFVVFVALNRFHETISNVKASNQHIALKTVALHPPEKCHEFSMKPQNFAIQCLKKQQPNLELKWCYRISMA